MAFEKRTKLESERWVSGMQEAEVGESLRQSTSEKKGTLFSSQILIKDFRLGEAVFMCVN